MPIFEAGDHIKVRRGLYTHHGIFVTETRVIDFSGGRNILEKPKALVQARTLREFEGRHGRAETVEHPGRFLAGLAFWPGPDWEYPPDEVVRRAEALCQVAATKGAYRLSGSNCEHIANWCKCGAHESKQVRYVHAVQVLIGLTLLTALGRGPSRWRPALTVVFLVSSAVTIGMQYEARTTPRRWRPIIKEAEALLRGYDRPPSTEQCTPGT
ncbi:MAG TPA: lecithin retinol acyltransferase family protein [Acidimicrobiales bacterium]|nr:lecithin retinol acyltransferase family protein [Acidimicrobiales bacterium]